MRYASGVFICRIQAMSNISNTSVNRSLSAPLYWQLYTNLRTAILAGRLKKGTKLPSTRALASELNVSRNTVLNAYEQLLAEGYLDSIEATGTFVASVLPDLLLTDASPIPTRTTTTRPARLSKLGETLRA